MTEKIKKWLETNTFKSEEFTNIAKLVDLKKEQGITISLGLPTKNVSETLGSILAMLKREFMQNSDLLDQIAIIDGHSSDETVEIAKKHDVEVYYEDEILTQAGVKKGKGEALWKSLAVLKGDIIIWIDSDIKNIHPRFVSGILGPMLANKKIDFVKSYYKRPILVGETIKNTGGGRVTELAVRPLFNLFYPQLTGFIQPLSGEYGGRRSLLESLPFYTGYAVETGLLIDIEKRFGLNVIAQVDLEERIHQNQSTVALGKMSFSIMQAFFQMLQADGKITLNERPNTDFYNVDCDRNVCQQYVEEIKIDKRPPIKEVEGYA
jgi:glycosyltransferase involved in cell wall biosynthesis